MPTDNARNLQQSYLQPHHVFMAELWRLNRAYWTSKYALDRMPAMLSAIAATASTEVDPFVLAVWPTQDQLARKNLNIPISQYQEHAAATIESTRALAVVGICSAFENALVNYFILACLYHPKSVLTGWNYAPAPKILRNLDAYKRLQKRAAEKAADALRAGYGTRVHVLLDSFGIDRRTLQLPDALENYHANRHLVAHNQGVEEDGPWQPPDELVGARVALSEDAWRRMLGDFDKLVTQVDALMQTVIPDRAVHLAVHWIMDHTQDAGLTLGTLVHRVNVAWRLREPTAAIERAAIDLGYEITKEKRAKGRRVSKKK